MTRYRPVLWLVVFIAGVVAACAGAEDPPDGAVHVLTADGSVGPIMERYIERGIDHAEDTRASLLVIQLDTPGGLSSSMQDIIQDILDSNVPVAVYVTPAGGRAASAGTFITMAAHIAAMAPATTIGAASAVNADGSDIEGALGRKIENDSVALIRALAEERGRNADWAESTVRDAVSDNSTRAAELGAIDFVAADLDGVLEEVDGSTIQLREGVTVELRGVADAPRVENNMSAWERFLEFIADPTLATILISIGFLAIIFELSNPGIFVPGVAGIIAIILGFMGLGTLPVETAGLVLIALGLLLLAIELFVQSGGVLGVGGVAALLLGIVIAFRETPPEFQPNRILAATLIILVVGAFVSMAVGVARARKIDRPIGVDALVGRIATARTPLTPEGFVFLEGERWKARLDSGVAGVGEELRVLSVDGFTLRVTKEV